MKKISIFLSSWWKRIIAFCLLFTLFYFPSSIFFANIFKSNLIEQQILIALSLILSSLCIEFFRFNNNPLLFGFLVTKNTNKEIIYALLLALLPFLLIFVYFCSSEVIRFNEVFDIKYHFFMIQFIFFSATIEELLYRGIIFQAIAEKFGYIPTIVISSFLFSIGHILNPDFNFFSLINTTLAGVVFGLMYWNTKSLFIPIIYHFFWNFLQNFLINSNVSGYDFGLSVIDLDYNNLNPILFGGSYGFEASIMCTLTLIATSFFIIILIHPSPIIESKLLLRNLKESKYF